jgi:hypothetical protein
VEYFRNAQGESFTQWITLFDDVDDDEFDGDLGEDDEELPMIKTTFVLAPLDDPKKQQIGSPPRAKQSTPKKEVPPPRTVAPV